MVGGSAVGEGAAGEIPFCWLRMKPGPSRRSHSARMRWVGGQFEKQPFVGQRASQQIGFANRAESIAPRRWWLACIKASK